MLEHHSRHCRRPVEYMQRLPCKVSSEHESHCADPPHSWLHGIVIGKRLPGPPDLLYFHPSIAVSLVALSRTRTSVASIGSYLLLRSRKSSYKPSRPGPTWLCSIGPGASRASLLHVCFRNHGQLPGDASSGRKISPDISSDRHVHCLTRCVSDRFAPDHPIHLDRGADCLHLAKVLHLCCPYVWVV